MSFKNKKILGVTIILFILSLSNIVIANPNNYRNTSLENFSYKQKINIPFDTSLEESKYQPIDIKIDFENTCYATDEKDHSIRIAIETKGSVEEIESQIYNLEKKDDTHITSCNVVFLIPTEADGNEEYYVFYDSKKTEETNYEDHITLEDSHYYYEPISGQKIDLDYFGIKEKGNVIYGIAQKGELLGNPIALSVLKFKPDSKVFETYNIDQLCTFDMRYGIIDQPGYYGTSWANNVKKTVLVDGNLMIRFRLKCNSPDGDMLSDNIYTYYHCPTDTKRIFVDCYHEILNDIKVEEPSFMDGTFGGIVSIKSRSSTIEKMDVGDIYPELYVYTKDEKINDFSVPQNPSSTVREAIIATEDDIDLGKNAWVCLADLEKGSAHGIVLDSNTGYSKGENDGVQIKAWVKENIKLPGLEADTGNLYIHRNSYENGKHNPDLDKGYSVNYKADFISVRDSYEKIDLESSIFQKISTIIPTLRENITEDEIEEKERFNLTTFVHMAPSFPMGSLLSAATGKKIPYIYAELYKENEFKSSGSVSRLALGDVNFDFEGKKVFEKIKMVLGIFDLKNSSLFKKIVFPDLVEGTYVVKIFRENPLIGKERKYIGFGIVEVKENTNLRIFCTANAKSSFSISDQNDNGIENVDFYLIFNDELISDSNSDENGSAILNAPCKLKDKYLLRVFYKGFLIEEKEIRLGFFNKFKEYKDNFNLDLYNLNVKLTDKWGFTPAVDANIFVTSNDMYKKETISSEKIDNSNYLFEKLISADYLLSLKYKSFELEENINLEDDKTINLEFPAEYKTKINVFNNIGANVNGGTIYVSRNNKKINTEINSKGKASFLVPPGTYDVEVFIDDEKVAFQEIDIKGEKTVDIVSNKDSFLHNVVLLVGLFLIFCTALFFFYKKKFKIGLKIAIILLLFISIFQPWWTLYGEENNISTETVTMLYPPKMVTLTDSSTGLGGSISILPPELTDLFVVLSIIIIVSIIFILSTIFIDKRFKKTKKALLTTVTFLIILSLGLFYYAMSQVTKLGVGSFIGSKDLAVTIPGRTESVNVFCSWGPGIGFYLLIISLILLLVYILFKKKFENNLLEDFSSKDKKDNGLGNYKTIPYSKFRKNIEIVTKEGWLKRSINVFLEIDVTDAKNKIKKYKEKTGEKISFTGWIIKCVSESLSRHKMLNAYRQGRNKIVIFDDVDVAVPVERKSGDESRPRVYILRKANEKTLKEISKEIRNVQKEEIDENIQVLGKNISRFEKFVLDLPIFIKKILMPFVRKRGLFKKKHMGTTGVTAIGMMGNFPGGVISLGGTATTLFVVGGITKKPRLIKNKTKTRDYLNLSVSIDHDIVDGGPIARFVDTLTNLMENSFSLHELK